MAGERGEYRAIPRVLIDGPDFQQLSTEARFVFVALKLNLGPTGIEVEYPDALICRLTAQTGIAPDVLRAALDELEAADWIEREANVIWIVAQLKHEPHMKVSDGKHRKAVHRQVAGLPHLVIVRRFVDFYAAWFVDAPTDPRDGLPKPSHTSQKDHARPIEGSSKDHARPIEAQDVTLTGTLEETPDACASGAAAPLDDKPPTDDGPHDGLHAFRSEAAGKLRSAGWREGGPVGGKPWSMNRELSIWDDLVRYTPAEEVNAALDKLVTDSAGKPRGPTLLWWRPDKPSAQEYYRECLAWGRSQLGRDGPVSVGALLKVVAA